MKLTSLAAAVLVLMVAATVWVQFERAKRARQREAMQAAVDAAAQKLNIRAETLYLNADARIRLLQVRNWAYQRRRSTDPARREDFDSAYPPDIDPESPPPSGADESAWFQGPPSTQPAPPKPELDLVGEDDGSSEIAQAIASCQTVQDWFEKPGDQVGAYLRKYPEFASPKITPLLLRLLGSEDEGLNQAACRTLFAMGDRSPRLQTELEKWAVDGGIYGPPPDPNEWTEMLQQFPRWVASTQASQPEPIVAIYEGSSAPADPLLPPGAMYMLGERRFRHGRDVSSLDFSPDGKTLLTAGADLLCLWDVATGELRAHLALPGKAVGQAAFLPDGRVLILAGRMISPEGYHAIDHFLTWKTGQKELEQLGPNGKDYGSFQISPDRKTLAATELGPVVQLFDLPSFKPGRRIVGSPKFSISGGVVIGPTFFSGLAFSPDSKTLACYLLGNVKGVLAYDVATGEEIHDWPFNTILKGRYFRSDPIFNSTTSPMIPADRGMAVDSQNRVSLVGDEETILLDLATGEVDKKTASGRFDKGGFSDGRIIAANAGEGMDIFLADTLKKIGTVRGKPVGAVRLSPDGTMLAWVQDNRALLWNLKEGRAHLPGALRPGQVFTFLDGDQNTLYLSAQENPYPAGKSRPNYAHRLTVWNYTDRKLLPSPLNPDQDTRLVAASINGNRLAAAAFRPVPGAGKKIFLTLYDLEGKAISDLPLPEKMENFLPDPPGPPGTSQPAPSPTIDPNSPDSIGQLLLSTPGGTLAWLNGGPDPTLCLWNAQNGKLQNCFNLPWPLSILESAFAQDARLIPVSLRFYGESFLAGYGGVLAGSAERVPRLFNPLVKVHSLAVAPANVSAASCDEATITIWRTESNWESDSDKIDKRSHHMDVIRRFKTGYSPSDGRPMVWIDAHVLAVVGDRLELWATNCPTYGSVDLWDVDSGKLLGVLGGIHSPAVSFFRPDGGGMFFTSHADGAIFAWDLAAIEKWCADRQKALAPKSGD